MLADVARQKLGQADRHGVPQLPHGFGPRAMKNKIVREQLQAGAFAHGQVAHGAIAVSYTHLQTQRLTVAADAVVEWLPQETIVYDGARVRTLTRVEPVSYTHLSLDRRVYNYNEINEIRRRLKRDASRPTSCVRLIFSNLKGGVGKTSHALHLSHYAARDGLRVLVVDLDPQATLTTAFGLVPGLNVGAEDDVGPSLTADPELIQKSIKPTRWNEIDLVPAQLSLQYTDWQMLQARDADSQRLGPLPQRCLLYTSRCV